MSETKVTIIVEGLGKQEIFLKREDAIRIYANASQNIVDKLLSTDKHECSCGGKCHDGVEDHQESTAFVFGEHPPDKGPVSSARIYPSVNDFAKDIKPDKVVVHNTTNFEKVEEPIIISRQQPWHIRTPKIDMDELDVYDGVKNPFVHDLFKNKKLVAYRCYDCGKVTVRNIVLAESNETTCHWCKEPVTIDKVVLAEISCDCCNHNHAYLYVANGLTEVACKFCESPIDIKYYMDGKKEKAKSPNLL